MKVQSAGPALYVSPITPDIEDIHERQARQFLYVLFKRFRALARRQAGATLLPGVSDKAMSKIFDGLIGSGRDQDGVPAFVLFDTERPLIKPIFYLRPRSKVVSIPTMCGHICRCLVSAQAVEQGDGRPRLYEFASVHEE